MKDKNSRLLIKNKRSGQSMIEVVIGIAVVVVLAISLITTTLITQKTATSAKNNSQATKLAQQMVERIRIYRDRVDFNSIPSNGCYSFNITDPNSPNSTSWKFAPLADCNAPTDKVALDNVDFYRKIQFGVSGNSNGKNVTITVSWTESAGPQSVVHNTRISAWCAGEIVAGPSPCPTP